MGGGDGLHYHNIHLENTFGYYAASFSHDAPCDPQLKFYHHLGVFLDSRLNFSKHIKEAIIKAKKGISLLKYLSKYVSRNVLDTCYKLYVRPHLDYGDVIYHNQRADHMNLIEQVQYKAALIASGCWQGTCCLKLYD